MTKSKGTKTSAPTSGITKQVTRVGGRSTNNTRSGNSSNSGNTNNYRIGGGGGSNNRNNYTPTTYPRY